MAKKGALFSLLATLLLACGTHVTESSSCMRKWLEMAGASSGSLDQLEAQARRAKLNEVDIRDVYDEEVLKLIAPLPVARRLRTCMRDPSACSGAKPCGKGVCSFSKAQSQHVCTCPTGLTGAMCENDIDECSTGAHTCDAPQRAFCRNTVGSYSCLCRNGYQGRYGRHCRDYDECADATHRCHANAMCTNTVGSYTCTCSSGFSGDGRHCKDLHSSTLMMQHRQQMNEMRRQLKRQQILLDQTMESLKLLSRAVASTPTPAAPVCKGISTWKYYPWYNWLNYHDNVELRAVTYNKQRSDTILRVAFHSTIGQNTHRGCKEYYITFAGQECNQPAKIVTSLLTENSDAGNTWVVAPAELSGFCSSTPAGRLSTGNIRIAVGVRNCPGPVSGYHGGDAHTGTNRFRSVTSYMLVEEYCPA